MKSLEKSEQWKRGAIVLAWIDERHPNASQYARDVNAATALRTIFAEVPWEYPWAEVIRSLRERSAARMAKNRRE